MKLKITLALLALITAALAWDYLQQRPPTSTAAPAVASLAPAEVQPLISPHHPLTVIHFWATWCAICMAEMPELLDAATNLPPTIHLAMVSHDTDPTPLNAFYIHHNLATTKHLSWHHNPSQTIGRSAVPAIVLPTTLVYTQQGELLQQVDGPLVWAPFLEVLAEQKGTR